MIFKYLLILISILVINPAGAFDGISSITSIQTDRATVSWETIPGPNSYVIYDITNGEPYTNLATRSNPTSQAIITGLTPSTEYTFIVKMVSDGEEDTNTKSITFTTLTPATALFKGHQVSARTAGSHDSVNSIGITTRMEFFDNGIFENENSGGTTQNPYSAAIIPTDKSIKSCIEFTGQNEILAVTLNLGFGNIIVNLHRMNGTCDGHTLNCFVFQSSDTNGDQRLMEVTPGGCDRVVSDFNNEGDLLVDVVESGINGVKSSPLMSDVSKLRVRLDGVIEIMDTPLSTITRNAVEYSELDFDRDIIACDSWVGDVSVLNLQSATIVGQLYKISGLCNETPVSCLFMDESYYDEVLELSVGQYRLLDRPGGNCSTFSAMFGVSGDIMGDPLYSGVEVAQYTPNPIPTTQRLRLFAEGSNETSELTKKITGSPVSNYITKFEALDMQSSTIPSCIELEVEIVSSALNKFSPGTTIEEGTIPLEYSRLTAISGFCDGEKVDCFETGLDALYEDVVDEDNNIIASVSDNLRRMYQGMNGVCTAGMIADFNERGTSIGEAVMDLTYMDNSYKFYYFSHGASRLIDTNNNTFTNSNSPIDRSDTAFPDPEIKSCREFLGEKDLYTGNINGTPYEILHYRGSCDGGELSCYIKENMTNGNKIMMRESDNLESCGRLALDFNDTGEVEGIAGSTAPPPPIPEFIPETGAKAYIFSVTNETLTLGLNPITKEPLVGSDWEVLLSDAFVGNCTQYDEHVFDDGDKISTVFSYLDPNIANCNTASHPKDPLNQVEWDNMGVTREAQHGTETIVCGRDNACDITMSINFREQVFSSLNPTQGVDGTAPGRGRVFVYDFKQVSTSNEKGEGGLGGLANLPINPITEKYCVDLKDLVTEGGGSSFAENPVLNMEVIQWEPFRQGGNAAQGVTPAASDERSFVMKGLSEGMLYYIKRDNIYLGTEWEE